MRILLNGYMDFIEEALGETTMEASKRPIQGGRLNGKARRRGRGGPVSFLKDSGFGSKDSA
jgi:hypothetical protein